MKRRANVKIKLDEKFGKDATEKITNALNNEVILVLASDPKEPMDISKAVGVVESGSAEIVEDNQIRYSFMFLEGMVPDKLPDPSAIKTSISMMGTTNENDQVEVEKVRFISIDLGNM